jgi:outer membrane protein OmpA-like peptidoglycan-associated protein
MKKLLTLIAITAAAVSATAQFQSPKIEVGAGYVFQHQEGFGIPRFTLAFNEIFTGFGLYTTAEYRSGVEFKEDGTNYYFRIPTGINYRHTSGIGVFASGDFFSLSLGKNFRKEVGLSYLFRNGLTVRTSYSHWVGLAAGVGYQFGPRAPRAKVNKEPIVLETPMVEAPKKEVIRENFTTITLVDGRVLSVKDAFKVGSYIYTSVTEVLLEDGTVSYNKTAIEPGSYETNNEYVFKVSSEGLIVAIDKKVLPPPAPEGPVLVVTVYFDFNKSSLTEESRIKLNEFVAIYKEKYTEKPLIVVGHTDTKGSDEINLRIGLERANAVAKYLKDNYGIVAQRVEVKSKGESEPISTDDAINRRGEVYVIL